MVYQEVYTVLNDTMKKYIFQDIPTLKVNGDDYYLQKDLFYLFAQNYNYKNQDVTQLIKDSFELHVIEHDEYPKRFLRKMIRVDKINEILFTPDLGLENFCRGNYSNYLRATLSVLLRKYTTMSLHEIGRATNRDHSTICHHLKKSFESFMYSHPNFKLVYEKAKERLDYIVEVEREGI